MDPRIAERTDRVHYVKVYYSAVAAGERSGCQGSWWNPGAVFLPGRAGRDRSPKSDSHAESDAKPDAFSHPDSCTNLNADKRANGYADPDANSNPDPDSGSYRHAESHSKPDSDSYKHTKSHSDSDTTSY